MYSYENAINTLSDSIYKAIDSKIEQLSCDKEAVIASQLDDDTYSVLINSYKYNVKNGTNLQFQEGDKCLVHYINGNQQRKIIIAKLKGKFIDDSTKGDIVFITHEEIDELFK